MILIGLFGGSPESREEITRVITRTGADVGAYGLSPTMGLSGTDRAEKLAVVLQGLGAQVKGATLIITHVLSREEADAIRARSGRLLYVMGEPSDVIPLQSEDLPVTAMAGGCRHYLDPLEAYSEILLSLGRVR